MYRTRCSAVKAGLRELLGGLDQGARLPSERDLASTFSVSRMTVRRSVQALMAEGRIVRDQRRGMFVADPKHVVDLSEVPCTSEGLSSKVVRTGVVPADDETAGELRIDPGDPVAQVDRLLTIGGRPMALDTTQVPDLRCPGLADVSASDVWPSAWLRDAWDITLSHTETSIASEVAGDLDVVQLGGGGQPVLVVRRIGYDGQDRPVLRSRERYRGDRFTLVASMVVG